LYQGTPSGEAFIQMNSEQTAEVSALAKHKKFMFMNNKKRYIEVIQCSGEDMNLVLTNGLAAGLPPHAMLPQSAVPTGMIQHRALMAPGMGIGSK
jgi:epithelial splicing regulatory protein 1/2